MNDTQLLELLATTDACADDAALPEVIWSRDAALAEIERRTDMTDTKTREPVTPAPRRPQRRAWLAAAAAFVIVVVAGVAIALASRGPEAPPAGPSTTTTEATTTNSGAAAAPTPLTTSFGSVEVGTYVLNSFGTTIEFTVDPSFFYVYENNFGKLALGAPNSSGPGDKDLVILRRGVLSDPAAPNASVADQGDGWPADDFGGWLDNVADGVIVVDRAETTVGGLPAIRAELTLGEIECFDDFYCALLTWSGGNYTPLWPGSTHVVWVIDDGAEEPLLVIVNIMNDRDRAWIDAFENLVSTFVIGG